MKSTTTRVEPSECKACDGSGLLDRCKACHGSGTDRYRRVCRDCEGLGIELPKSILLKRGNNSERLWTQKVLTEYSKIKGLKFQEVVWQILFVTASDMDLELQREHD